MAKQKQKQIRMQVQMGALAAIPQLESRTDEQLQGESRHRVAAKAILGARAAERYDAKAARAYFNEALAGAHPQERPALRQMMKASLALAGGTSSPIIRSMNIWRPEGASWPSFSMASLSSSGLRSASAREAFII